VQLLIVVILGYRWLFEAPNILHRDISLNNIMLRKEGDKIYPVLNDIDLAVSTDVKSTPSKQCMGTKPFMAIDLLRPDPPVHMYHHDLESMFYILIWTMSRFHNGDEITLPPLQEWADNDSVTDGEEKLFCYDVRISSANTAVWLIQTLGSFYADHVSRWFLF